jgi:hypothetical protein
LVLRVDSSILSLFRDAVPLAGTLRRSEARCGTAGTWARRLPRSSAGASASADPFSSGGTEWPGRGMGGAGVRRPTTGAAPGRRLSLCTVRRQLPPVPKHGRCLSGMREPVPARRPSDLRWGVARDNHYPI